MASGEASGFGYWVGVRVAESAIQFRDEVPKDKRALFRKLVRFLIANEFEHVDQLKDGAHTCEAKHA